MTGLSAPRAGREPACPDRVSRGLRTAPWRRCRPLVVGALIALTAHGARARAQGASSPDGWKADWELTEGYRAEIDTEGYSFPVNLAFVPRPGERPDDPLYFVVELRGRVKVVTNDRTVHVFARDVTNFVPTEELPSAEGESGAAGIALDPVTGYVFVSFTYESATGVLRNDIARYSTRPGTFALEPSGRVTFTDVFRRHPSAISHQIGPMQVHGSHLYVSVGDAERPWLARELDNPCGKILRMTLDGEPVPSNPHYRDDGVTTPSDYVWARGLRNPFGLKVFPDGRVFAADNGPDVDRVLAVKAGGDYLHDGSNWSMATKALYVFAPSVSPVTFDLHPPGSGLFPDGDGRIYMALSGSPAGRPGPGDRGQKSVVSFGLDLVAAEVTSTPEHFLRYRGAGPQAVTGLAFGPDALYVVPLLPGSTGRSPVLRITHDPAVGHPFLVSDLTSMHEPVSYLMQRKGCFGCHSLDEDPGAIGPSLDPQTLSRRILERLESSEYLASLEILERQEAEIGISHAEARRAVLAAEGTDKVRAWVYFHLKEPRFDNMRARMPNLRLSDEVIRILTAYLVRDVGAGSPEGGPAAAPAPGTPTPVEPLPPSPLHDAAVFGGGLLVAWLVGQLRSRRRASG